MIENPLYEELKRRIILLEYSPGSILREKEIMKEFGVSRTPVREALMQLQMAGLVRIFPHVGSFVSDISFQQLKDVFEVRSFLVRQAGHLAAVRITDEELAEINEHVGRMKAAPDLKTVMRIDEEIHDIINRATKNQVLVKILEGLHDQAIRIWAFSKAENNYWNHVPKEFEDILAALKEGDGEAAADLLENHTKRFVEHIRAQFMV
ncbi:MAG: GntR family transcriptional regulator [Desulfobacterales bacterium]|jgi:GntR family transcriptional regulator, rspAB operon transcriptional repressor